MHKHTVTTANGTVLKRNSKNRIYAFVAVETCTYEGKITEKAVIWSGTREGARKEITYRQNRTAKGVAGGWSDPAYVHTYTILTPTVVSKIDPVQFMKDHFQVIHVG